MSSHLSCQVLVLYSLVMITSYKLWLAGFWVIEGDDGKHNHKTNRRNNIERGVAHRVLRLAAYRDDENERHDGVVICSLFNRIFLWYRRKQKSVKRCHPHENYLSQHLGGESF